MTPMSVVLKLLLQAEADMNKPDVSVPPSARESLGTAISLLGRYCGPEGTQMLKEAYPI